MLAKVDTPLDMAEGISYHLQQLMNEKDDASDNLENGHKGGSRHTHKENNMRLKQHGTFAYFNDEFDATSLNFALLKNTLLVLIWLVLMKNMLAQSIFFKRRTMREPHSLAHMQETMLQK